MFSYSGLSFNAAASRELGLMPSYTKTQEDSDCEDIWHSLSSSMMWMTIDMDESESSSKEGSEEVRTVFVSGLPMDVRPREIYLLFRPYSGYVGSCLKLMAKPGKLTQPVAFVTFETRKQAEKAISDLQGICFDPSQAQTLRLELARSNSRNAVKKTVPVKTVNRSGTFVQFPAQSAVPNGYGFLNLTHNPWGPPQPAPVPVGTYVDMTPYGGFEESPTPGGPGLPTQPSQPQLIQGFIPGLRPAYSNMYHHTPHQYVCMGPVQWPPGHVVPMAATIPGHNNNGGHSYDHDMSGEVGNPLMNHSENVEFEEQSTLDNGIQNPAPCSTLFVANLEPHQQEEEITSLFSACEGFMKAKIYAKNGPPVCFVHFKDVSSAMQSMNTLQGCVLPTSRRGCGIRIEYARQRMGSPRRSSTSSTRSTSTPHSDSSSTYSN